jgi:transcriptional adapter 2-alpha
MDLEFDIDPEIFHERKRRRISEMNNREPPPFKTAPTSQPGVHEIATFLPGRLEFEHEIDNEAEDLVKDLEFGVVADYGGDQMVEDEDDLDVKARAKWLEDRRLGLIPGHRDPSVPAGKGYMVNGLVNGYHTNGDVKKLKTEDSVDDEAADEAIQPQPYETKESLAFKLTLLEMYFQRIEKRLESKAVIFDRGLLEYKKVCLLNLRYIFSFSFSLLCRSK